MRPSDKAWLTLAAGVVAWDAFCGRGEMLSEASARYTSARPLLWRGVVLYTAGHLIHAIPSRLDLFAIAAHRLSVVRPKLVACARSGGKFPVMRDITKHRR